MRSVLRRGMVAAITVTLVVSACGEGLSEVERGWCLDPTSSRAVVRAFNEM